MEDKYTKIRNDIDSDKGFYKQKKALLISSSILLITSILDINIQEINFYFVKFSIENDNYLSYILFVCTFVLTIRFYGYSSHYQENLKEYRLADLLKDSFFFLNNPHTDEVSGIVGRFLPDEMDPHQQHYSHETEDYEFTFKRKFFLSRQIIYSWRNKYHDYYYEKQVNLFKKLSLKEYITVLIKEDKLFLVNLIRHREYFDIFLPYIISFCSMLAFLLIEAKLFL